MIVHVYTMCWNEEKMLPYFFKHYDNIADKYYVLDNNSTDNSYSILKSHPNVEVNRIELQGDSSMEAAQRQYNSMWKQSRKIADWVIVCDVDEHLYHRDLRNYFQVCTFMGATLIVPVGYEMVSDTFPISNKPLCENVRYGVRKYRMDKPQIFNPTEIEEINFQPGRHYANPVGNVITMIDSEVLLLHYKYLGFDYVSKKYLGLRTKLRKDDKLHGYGWQYDWSEKQIQNRLLELKNAAIQVI